MTKFWVALPLVVLAGCSTARTAGTAEERACEREANDSPIVQQLVLTGLGNPYFRANNQDELAAAKQQALLGCLRRTGLVPKGGVERQKPLE